MAIGLLQGFFVARLGVPSFVVTLAGLLGWNGVLLQIIGSSGTIVIQNSFVNSIANNYMSAALAWIVAILLVAALCVPRAIERISPAPGGSAQ